MIQGAAGVPKLSERVPACARIFNICATQNLYYNDLISVLCRERDFARQGPVSFLPDMAEQMTANDALKSIRARVVAPVLRVFLPVLSALFFLVLPQLSSSVRAQEPDVQSVIRELSDKSDSARAAAARKLGAAADPRAGKALSDGLKTEKNPYVRSRLVEAIGKRSDAGSAAELSAIARTDADEDSRLAAVAALGNSRQASVVPVLLEKFGDTKETLGVRLRAADALANYPTDEVFTAFSAALGDGNAEIKRQALVSLYNGFAWDKQRTLPLVRRAAADKDTEKIARQYLKNLGEKK